MRRLIALASIAALALAACGTAAAPTPASTRSPAPAPPSVAPTPAPPVDAIVDVQVTFDGTECVYGGPAAVPNGTKLRFVYQPTAAVADRSKAVILAVRPGTTWEEILEVPRQDVVSVLPPWAIDPFYVVTTGQTSVITLVTFAREPIGGYYVGCTLDDVPFNAALIDVVD